MKYSVLKRARRLWILLSLGSLAGCGAFFGDDGMFRDRGDDYLKAETIPPLQVPGSMDDDTLGQLYVIPETNKAAYEYPEQFEAPRPEALSSNVYSEAVKIQKLGRDRWIFVSAAPGEVWPRVRNFLNENGLPVVRIDAPQGVMETAWLNFKDDPDNRDKYRLRIEQGIHPDSSEVHVTHLSMSRDSTLPEQVNWPERSSSLERESWMIDELAVKLAAEIDAASASLLAQTIGGKPKVEVLAQNGEPILRMDLEMPRAWATLSHALQQENLKLIDTDRKAQMFYAQMKDPEEDDGFFSGWFGGNDETEEYTVDDLLRQMNLEDSAANRALFPSRAFAGEEEALADLSGYLFIVRENEGAIQVVVRDPHGQPLDPRDARELLGTVRRNLI